MKKAVNAVKKNIKDGNERGARYAVLEDLFNDFNRSRFQIYKMNFFRGIFFGLGSVLGGTVLIAFIAWALSFFVTLPGVGQPIEKVQQSINSRDR